MTAIPNTSKQKEKKNNSHIVQWKNNDVVHNQGTPENCSV